MNHPSRPDTFVYLRGENHEQDEFGSLSPTPMTTVGKRINLGLAWLAVALSLLGMGAALGYRLKTQHVRDAVTTIERYNEDFKASIQRIDVRQRELVNDLATCRARCP